MSNRPFRFAFHRGATAVLLLAAATAAQQTVPFTKAGDMLVADTSGDRIWRLRDMNLDGDYDDAGEVFPFFLSGTNGFALTNPAGMTVDQDGSVFVADTTADTILRLRDLDGNGDALGAAESSIFFSGAGNQSGVTMPTGMGIAIGLDGRVWVANSNTSTAGIDSVLQLQDLNWDGDAEDAGEAIVYASFAPAGALGDSIPSHVVVAPDGTIYFLDNGSTGVIARGIYRLHDDIVPNGHCNDPGEVSPFYLPAPQAATSFLWGLTVGRDGGFYVADSGTERILKVRDISGDFLIQNATAEEVLYFAVPASSLMWNTALDANGTLYVTEDQTPDRLYALTDLDQNGDCLGPNEKTDIYTDTLASVDIGAPRVIAFQRGPGLVLSPSPAPIGGLATLYMEGQAGTFMNVWLSAGTTSLSVPPYGTLGLAVFTPGTFLELIPPFVMNSTGTVAVTFGIPSDPGLASLSVWAQAIGGPPASPRLGNLLPVTFQ